MAKKPYSGNADNWTYNPRVFDPHPWHKRKPVHWEMLVVHCAATKASMDVGVNQIDYWHRQRGFEGVGYNWVIRRDGTIEAGRPETIPGAHAAGYNRNALSICLVGGLNDKTGKAENNFTDEQFASLYLKAFDMIGMWHLTAMVGHRDLPNVAKDCPCFDVKKWVSNYPSLVDLIESNLRKQFDHSSK